MEGSAADVELLGCLGAVAFAFGQGLEDEGAFIGLDVQVIFRGGQLGGRFFGRCLELVADSLADIGRDVI